MGALALAWTPEHADRFHEVDPRLPASFAEQAALALAGRSARERPSSGWRSSRTATGSAATCTTW